MHQASKASQNLECSKPLINWEDFVTDGWDPQFFADPVFSKPEQRAIELFCTLWNKTADVTHDDEFNAERLRHQPHWVKFVETAQINLDLFMQRGRFSEEAEAF